MSNREYIKNLTIGQSFIVDSPLDDIIRKTTYVVESIFSEAGKTVVGYSAPSAPDAGIWTLVRPSLTLVTLS